MNMKKVNLFLLLILLSPCLLFMSACGTQPVKYSIRFMVGETPYAIVETRGNETIHMPEDPIKEGYTFDGWYCDNNVWQQPFTANSLVNTPLSRDMKVYAKFSLTHSHILVKVERKEPTCTETGYEEYFKCECGKLFSDENGNNEISAIKTISATGHAFGEWYEVKPASYTEEGQDRRDCSKCDYYETRKVDKLFADVIEPTSLTIEYGILKWNGSSPFGFDVVVNGVSKTVYDNAYEASLKSDDYNSVKVACIYENGTKSNYVELDDFVVNAPITNLHFIDDGNYVNFTWDSPSNLYSYIFMYNNIEKNIVGTQHYYSVPRNQLQKGAEISIYIDGLSSANFYPSKKYTIVLEQLDAPNLQINKLNVEWNEVTNANEYKVQALTTLTQTATSYSYDGADGGNHSITVTAFGADFLNNSATLTFIKLKQPNIDIKENLASWDAIAGQVRYAVLIDDVETKFIGNTYTIQNTNPEYDIYLYASPVQSNTMQSDRVIISKFCYMQYSTVYWGTIVANNPNYLKVVDTDTLYVPSELLSVDFSGLNHNVVLIASSVPKTIDKNYITEIIVPDGTTSIIQNAFNGCTKVTNITIPESVTSIGSSAFKGCSSLVEITIPLVGGSITENTYLGYIFGASSYSYNSSCVPSTLNKVVITSGTYIGEGAFYGCRGLTSITISDSVTSLGRIAFSDCSNLASITIPKSVLDIGDSAFGGCSGITSITIPDSVASIGNYAFSGCSSLISINIPDSVTSIGKGAFSSCRSLSEVHITCLEAWFNIDFDYSTSNPLYYAHHLYLNGKELTEVAIPDTVSEIKKYVLQGASLITSIIIPDSVTSIGSSAFGGCSSIEEITIPFVGESVSGNTYLGYIFGASSYSGNSTYVPSSLRKVVLTGGTHVGKYAFNGCNGLTSITISETVTSIDVNAFLGCSSLRSLEVDKGNEKYYSAGNCIIDTANKTVVVGCNASIMPNDGSIEHVGDRSFFGCDELIFIYIPDSVISIGKDAFSSCSKLSEVRISSLESWLNIDFKYSSSNPLYYAHHLYLNGEELTEVTIPDTVSEIKKYALQGASSIISLTIPKTITSILGNAFDGCDSLCDVRISSLESWFNIDFDQSTSNPLYYAHHLYLNGEELTEVTVPEMVTEIKKYALQGASSITSIIIPDSVTSIGSSAFGGCSSLEEITIPFAGGSMPYSTVGQIFGSPTSSYNSSYVPSSLKKVIVTGGTRIGEGAFCGFKSLTSITIPETITSIGQLAFSGCESLVSVNIPNKLTEIKQYTFLGCSSLTELTIPSGVTTIEGHAFYGCSSLSAITIPSCVTTIESYAFSDCSSLTSINLPEAAISIESGAFSGCNNLSEVRISSLESWLNMDFEYSTSNPLYYAHHLYLNGEELTEITIPDTVTEIKMYALLEASSVTSIIIPDSVTGIGHGAFEGCSSLTSITIPDSVTSIDSYAFSGCSGLTTIILPKTMTSIDIYAFENCSSLTTIILPDSIKRIGYDAFQNCNNLTIFCEVDSQPNEWDSKWNENYTGQVYWYSETQPTVSGNYWHYVDGKATKW